MSSRCEEDLFNSIFTVEIDEEASPQEEGLNFENCIRDASKYHRGRKVKHKEGEFGKGFFLGSKNCAFGRCASCCYCSAARSLNEEGWHQPEEFIDLVALPAKIRRITSFCTAWLLNLDFNFEITKIADKDSGTYLSNCCL